MKNEHRTIFGKRLRQARKWKGLPQDHLGVAIGLDKNTASARISRYETGVHEPSIALARHLADKLGVPLPFLYCDSDDMAMVLLRMHGVSREARAALKERL